MKYNFIRTSDKETCDKLRDEGFTFLSKDGDTFVFLNDRKLTFDSKNVHYTNMLNV